MNDRNLKELEEAIRAVCEFKQRRPYYYLDWSTKKSDSDGNAALCGKMLDRIINLLSPLLEEAGIAAGDIRKAAGASYYPRSPWIGFFAKGEKPKNGIYPVISFSEDGLYVYVGCTSSQESPQPYFLEEYCHERSTENLFGIFATGTIRMSCESIDGGAVINAIRMACMIRDEFRRKHPIANAMVISKCPVSRLEDDESLRALLRKWFDLYELQSFEGARSASLREWWRSVGRDLFKKDLYSRDVDFPNNQLELIAEAELQNWDKIKKDREAWSHLRAKRIADEEWYAPTVYQDLFKWLKDIESVNKSEGLLAFRGQGDARWKLETGLGLKIFKDGLLKPHVEKVLAYERESMQTFRREVSKSPEYGNFDDVDLLALMQHYGSKTRLLDFSLSPLVALYMALDQHDNYVAQAGLYNSFHGVEALDFESDVVVWMLDIKQFAYPGFENDLNVGFATPGIVATNTVPWWKAKDVFHRDAERILKSEGPQNYYPGVDVVFPSINSARISSQEGLFLMPRRLDRTFHENLTDEVQRATKTGSFIKPRKYIFPSQCLKHLRAQLQSIFVTSKMMYPDLIGLAQSLNSQASF